MFTMKDAVTEVIKRHHYNSKAHVCSNVEDNFKQILNFKDQSNWFI